MTKNQEIRAQLLRLDGKNVMEIAQILGVPEDEVANISNQKRYKQSVVGSENAKFINLDRWMRENGITRSMFADKSGINYSTLNMIIAGKTDFGKSSIDKILKTTGLTYEEAFKEAE